jgi:hypothetical protein
MGITPEFGDFDYIIAHGFYSWVPKPAQDKLLAICQSNLRANGIAFISYNTHPAGRIRQLSRDLMLFPNGGTIQSVEQVRKGKVFLRLVAGGVTNEGVWKSVLQSELARVEKHDDRVTYHDELGDSYSPVYFQDFVRMASEYELQFLSEARLSDALETELAPELREAVEKFAGGELIIYQQLLDLLLFRGFRRTLLCHSRISLERNKPAERVRKLWVASPLKKVGKRPDGGYEFSNSLGAGTLATNNLLAVRALERLGEIWPQGERFSDLLQAIAPGLPEPFEHKGNDLSRTLLKLAGSGLVDLRSYRLPITKRDNNTPVATALARLEAEKGTVVTTLLHTQVEIKDELTRRMLLLLDGSRHRDSLTAWLMKQQLGVSRKESEQRVSKTLAGLYRMGLLTTR